MKTISKLTAALSLGVISFTSLPALAQDIPSELFQQARTICREDGRCFNTSGRPIYQRPERREWRERRDYGDYDGMRRERDVDRRDRY